MPNYGSTLLSTAPAIVGLAELATPPPLRRWPELNPRLRARIVGRGCRIDQLQYESPVKCAEELSAAEALGYLFPDVLLCCGASTFEFDVRLRSEWGDTVSQLQFVVPSPMSAVWAETQEGKPSKHTLKNTGPRAYQVVEFDQGSADEHAAILVHLAEHAPFAAAVRSGGKSLHGWFCVDGQPEDRVEAFFKYAVSLGADPATWVRSQFVRMPNGRRDNGALQELVYLNPQAVRLVGKCVGE